MFSYTDTFNPVLYISYYYALFFAQLKYLSAQKS